MCDSVQIKFHLSINIFRLPICLNNIRPPLKIQISSQYFVAHKKCFLTYQPYGAPTFFVPALSCLELRIFRGAHKKLLEAIFSVFLQSGTNAKKKIAHALLFIQAVR